MGDVSKSVSDFLNKNIISGTEYTRVHAQTLFFRTNHLLPTRVLLWICRFRDGANTPLTKLNTRSQTSELWQRKH